MRNSKLSLFLVLLVAISLGCNLSGKGNATGITVEISSPLDGTSVIVGEEAFVVASVVADEGVSKIYLSVNGQIVSTEEPGGLPQFYVSNFEWTPDSPGVAVLSVVAADSGGNSSEPVSVTIGIQAQSVKVPETDSPEPSDATITPEAEITNTPQPPVGATDTPKPQAPTYEPTITPTLKSVSGLVLLPEVVEVQNSGAIGPNSTNHVIAQCPSGGVVVGGGYYNVNPSAVEILISRKKDNGWAIHAINNSPFSEDIVSQVTCLMNVAGASSTMVETQGTIPADQFGYVFAQCPTGTTATGGGYGADSDLEITESLPGPDGWQATAKNTVGKTKNWFVYAICLSSNLDTSTRTESQISSIPAKNSSGGEGGCYPRGYATGGGFRLDGVFNLDVYLSMHSNDGKWQVLAQNPTEYEHLLEIYYFCLEIH